MSVVAVNNQISQHELYQLQGLGSQQQNQHQTQTKKQYIRNRVLGAGSYGQAVLVSLAGTSKQFVIKEVALQKMKSKDRNDILKEAYIMSRLNHPNIVHYEETFVSKDVLCMVMEFANYGDLAKQIKYRARASSVNGSDKKYFTEDQILDMLTQLCLSVKYLHDRNILHRDIKSQNLLLSINPCANMEDNVVWADEEAFCYINSPKYNPEICKIIQERRFEELETNEFYQNHCREKWNKAPRLLLCDFGVSKLLDRTMDAALTSVGTPYYISPEIIGGKSYGKASDMYSVGVVLFEMMNLRYPFEASNIQALAMAIMKNNYVIDTESIYSPDLIRILRLLLDVHEENRPTAKMLLEHPLLRCRLPQFISKQRFIVEFPQIQYALINKCPIPSEEPNYYKIASAEGNSEVNALAKEYRLIANCIYQANETKKKAIAEGMDLITAQKLYNAQMKQAMKRLNSKDPLVLKNIDNSVLKKYLRKYSVDLSKCTGLENECNQKPEKEEEVITVPNAPKQTVQKGPVAKIHGEIQIESPQQAFVVPSVFPNNSDSEENPTGQKTNINENSSVNAVDNNTEEKDKKDHRIIKESQARTDINLNSEHIARSNFKTAFESSETHESKRDLLPINVTNDRKHLITDSDIIRCLGENDQGVIELIKIIQKIDKLVYQLQMRMGEELYLQCYMKSKELSHEMGPGLQKSLLDVIKEKIPEISDIYQRALYQICILEDKFTVMKTELIERVTEKLYSDSDIKKQIAIKNLTK